MYFLRKAEKCFGVCIVKNTLILRVQLKYRIVEEVFDLKKQFSPQNVLCSEC
jgi:hypothetical protein